MGAIEYGRPQRDDLSDVEAERAILGTLLQEVPFNPRLLHDVEQLLRPEDFADDRRAWAYRGMLAFKRTPSDLNIHSLSQWLKEHGRLAEVGGPAALMLESSALLGGLGLMRQVAVVTELAVRRRGRLLALAVAEEFSRLSRPVARVALDASSKLARMGQATSEEVPRGDEVLQRVLERSDAAQSGKLVKLVRTNISAWDQVLRGIPLEELTVIAGQPGGGKSTLLGTMLRAIAEGGAEQEPVPVFLDSLEDAGVWAPGRLLAEESGLSLRELYAPGLSEEQLHQRDQGAERLFSPLSNTWICDKRGQNVHQVAARASQLIARYGVRVVLVDHLLELVDFADERRQDERIGEILRVLRELAGDCKVAVVLAAHLRRPKDDSISAQYQRPTLQAFAGSSYVERMARMAVGLWYPKAPPAPQPKKVAQPKVPKRATPNEAAAIHEAWQEARRAAESEHQKARGQWEAMRELATTSLVCTPLKVTEGPPEQDFLIRRVLHAGLVSRTAPAGSLSSVGYGGEG